MFNKILLREYHLLFGRIKRSTGIRIIPAKRLTDKELALIMQCIDNSNIPLHTSRNQLLAQTIVLDPSKRNNKEMLSMVLSYLRNMHDRKALGR